MKAKKQHPLTEILGKKLLGIESVPKEEQSKMVGRAIKAAVEFYENKICSECGFKFSYMNSCECGKPTDAFVICRECGKRKIF